METLDFNPDAYLADGSTSGGFDPDAYLGIKKQPPINVKEELAKAAMGPLFSNTLFGRVVANPAKAQKQFGAALPILGGMLAGPAGAALGETANVAAGTALGNPQTPSTPLGIGADVIGAGVMQEPKILKAIPGVSQVGEMASNMLSKTGKSIGTGAAKFAEALTGTKAKDLEQGARQGIATYLDPSIEKAGKVFGKAMEDAGIPGKPPLRQIIDPQLSTARKVALRVGDKLEKGLDIGAGEALQARQAIDRIYNATSLVDRATRGQLAELRTAFDDVIAGKSGALKEASTLYRKAIVKSNLLNPFRITKQGQMSAVAPMVATLAASAGMGSGHKEGAGLGGLGYLAASSPAVAGAIATGGGSLARTGFALAERPEVRQVLFQLLQQLRAKNERPGQ